MPARKCASSEAAPLPEALVVADPAFLADLREISQTPSARFHDPRGRGRRRQLTVLAGLAVVAIVAAIYLWGIPVAAEVVAARVPITWEESLGRSVVDSLVPRERRCLTEAGQRALDELVATLVAAAPPSGYTFHAQVADMKIVNAFAVPGGYIVVLRGLLEEMRTAEELAGVLAHEIQHVLRRHSTKALVQHLSTGLLLTAVSGDVSGVMAYGLEGARVLGPAPVRPRRRGGGRCPGHAADYRGRARSAGDDRLLRDDPEGGGEGGRPARLPFQSSRSGRSDRAPHPTGAGGAPAPPASPRGDRVGRASSHLRQAQRDPLTGCLSAGDGARRVPRPAAVRSPTPQCQSCHLGGGGWRRGARSCSRMQYVTC